MVKFKSGAIVLGLISITLAFTSPGERYFEIAKNLDIFATLFKEVNALYVDEINPNMVMRTGIEAMLASLDPYTNYIPEDDIENFRTQSTGQYGGIGAVTSRIGDEIRVTMVLEGYSAQKNGLKIGDKIIKIDDIDIRKMSTNEAGELMKGQANTPVSLTVMRYGENEPIELNFKREKVKISNVPYYGMVTDDIGYVKLTEFTVQAGKEVENAVRSLKEQGAKGIMLDLRGNPGGLLLEAVNISNVFIPKNQEVVTTKGKITENNTTYKTLNNPVDTDIPLAVLINSGSASASEIVAGTIQDYDRGVIIGAKSFGKGLVQVTRPLSYNSQLKVTTAKYYTPSGRCIQALDYTHRNIDGSVGKIPDSLKAEFRTTHDRLVFDGGGIDPDIETKNKPLSKIAYTLFVKGLIFDYATQYYYQNPKIADPKNFRLSDADYTNFKDWLKDKDYTYTTEVEDNLDDLLKNSTEANYYQDIKPQLEELRKSIEQSKANDLTDYKNQITELLEEEIVSRYYLEKGKVESSFDHDLTVQKAIEILHDPVTYSDILK